MIRIFKFTNDGTATFQCYHFDSLHSTNEMETIKEKLIETDLCKYPNQNPIISWKRVKCRRQSEVECGPRVCQMICFKISYTLLRNMVVEQIAEMFNYGYNFVLKLAQLPCL